MWGQLCYRGRHEPATVQLLVHGATHNHLYWDFPYADGYYSYVDAATAAGYATFDVDRACGTALAVMTMTAARLRSQTKTTSGKARPKPKAMNA